MHHSTMSSAGKGILLLAILGLLHAAYSAYEHLSLLKALDRPSRVPIDIAIESILAFAVFLFGVSLSSSELKEISWASEMRYRKIDDVHSRLGFASFNHRGKQLYGGKAPAE
ncbi:Membrane magnesium transporter [Rhizoctonia solani]|uniref:Membrane magnesium transporter n=2 Tax=Rhizoctonia solani TaxID=456999 RepID=A0A8H8SSE5_9AGAM